MFRNIKISVRTSILITTFLIIGFLVLWFEVDSKSTNMVTEIITNQMTDAVESRSAIINDYVSEAENYLVAFAQSDEVRNLLKDADAETVIDRKSDPQALTKEGKVPGESSEKIVRRAQEYTVDFANVKGIFEGLYIATCETHILTHTSEGAIGIRTRTGDALAPFQKQILGEDKLTNLGIMKSPGTGNMCISMYYPVFVNKKAIGYVGTAVYANKLMEALVSLQVEGLPNSEYIFLNVETGEYLYNEDETVLCTVTEDEGCLKMLDAIKENPEKLTGIVNYTDAEGNEQIIVYRYIPERNWVFALKDTNENVYRPLKSIRRTIGIVCVVIMIVITGLLILVLSNVGRQLKLISNAIGKLGDMDLSAGNYLEKYSNQRDEVGIICNSLTKACSNLNLYIGEVDRQLSKMAKGDFTGGSQVKFAGEFEKLQSSMRTIQEAMQETFTEIHTVTEELVFGSESVSNSATSLANAAGQASSLIAEIENNTKEIAGGLEETAQFALHAKEETANANKVVEESQNKMDSLSDALKQIEEATSAIEGISNNLESIAKQTNILALNALVEANRAGDSGRGFSVVANEIRLLAEQSSQAALNAYELIHQTLACVSEGMRLGQETNESLQAAVAQTNSIDHSVSRIADATQVQNEKLQSITLSLKDISKTVDTTAAMSQQSAAASNELDGQTNVLRENIDRFKI